VKPKWSKTKRSTAASRSRGHLLFAVAIAVGGCSDLDPNIGPPRTEPVEDAGDDAGMPEGGDPDDAGLGTVSFKEQIRPLFARGGRDVPKGCKGCHYRTEAIHNGLDLSGLDVSTLGALRRGGGSSGTRIIVPGKPKNSALVQVLRGSYGYAPRMPKNGPYWENDLIDLVETWISEGAKGADDE
jgi:Planctomycete cytochrome C